MRVTPWRLLPALVLLSSCTGAPAPFGDDERRAVERELADQVAALTAAMNAGDAPAVLGFYHDGPDFVYLGCTSYIMGGDVFERLVSPSYLANPGVVFEQELVATQVLGPDAGVVSLRGASSRAPALFWTQTWQRTQDGWRITMEHESWPGCSEPSDPHPFTGAADPSEAGR